MVYKKKIIWLLNRIEESRLKDAYNMLLYYYLKSGA